jgi:hypothetical protein
MDSGNPPVISSNDPAKIKTTTKHRYENSPAGID